MTMRCSAAFTTLFLCSALVLCQSIAPSPTDDSISQVSLLYENDEEAIFSFRITCSEAFEGEGDTTLMLDFGIRRTERACTGVGLSLNGVELILSWSDTHLAQGSGIIPTISEQSSLSAKWESACIPVPKTLSNDGTAQLLTAQIDRVGDVALSESLAFTIIFTQVGRPQILKLQHTPPNETINCPLPEDPTNPDSLHCLDFQPTSVGQPPDQSIEWHWDYLQSLKASADDLNQRIKLEEALLETLRQQECPLSVPEWEECENFSCRVKACVMKVPDLFRQIKYQLGLNSPITDDMFCSWCPQHTRCAANLTPPKANVSSTQTLIPNPHDDAGLSASPTPISDMYTTDLQDSLSQTTAEYYWTICTALLVLVVASSVSVFLCRNTMRCQRRRVDRATCREERRTRRAYRVAARQHQWRQWWEGTTTPTVIVTPDHDGHSVTDQEIQTHETDTLSVVSVEPDIMQAEIWGFRQALDYVRELVRSPSHDLERGAENHNVNTDRQIVELLNRRRTKAPSTVASSTAGLSTAISIGTNSFLSLETGSSETVDTLESADPPPSYRS